MRPGFLIFSCILSLAGGLFTPGCGDGSRTEVAFVLVRLEDLDQGASSLRAGGLDRLHVVEATCEILKGDGTSVARETFEVDPEAQPGEQEVRLRGIRAGSNYFARILGLDNQGAVYECGITGPLTIKSGKKHFIEIVIVTPPEGDPGCDQLCKSDEECPAGSFCPSPLVRVDNSPCIELLNCTPALCKPFSVGAPCEHSEDCGPELGCIGENYGYPNGYCMAGCKTDAECPQGQNWSSSCCPADIAGVAEPVCTRDCENNEDCRWGEGYECKTIDAGKSGCLPL